MFDFFVKLKKKSVTAQRQTVKTNAYVHEIISAVFVELLILKIRKFWYLLGPCFSRI